MNVLLIDGTFELFRAFYSKYVFEGSFEVDLDGQSLEVGAARQWVRSIRSLLNKPSVTHAAVAFDSTLESFRNQLFDGYKTGEGIDPQLWAQFPVVESLAEELGLQVMRMKEFEADDGLATAAHLLSEDPRVESIVLASPDKDMMQCVGGKVKVWDRMRKKVYGEPEVLEKWGVLPKSMPDWLALVGDAADGLPGIPKWGAKSTATLLREYHHLDQIPDDPEKWLVKVRGAKALAQSLQAHRSEASLYRHLATLRCDAVDEIGFEGVDALRVRTPSQQERPLLQRLALASSVARDDQIRKNQT